MPPASTRAPASSPSPSSPQLGLYIVRGDQLCVLGAVDEAADAAVDWATTRGSKPEPILVGVL